MSSKPEQRFSDRVANYVCYRPSYPVEVLEHLQSEIGLTPNSVVADIGSGTGISAALFLRYGCEVFAVEPNREMRAAAEQALSSYERFHSVDGKAEATTLPDRSIDLIVAAQAFHWFQGEATRAEFNRLLKPTGYVMLIWNERHLDTTPFLRGYEQLLLTHATDYAQVRHENIQSEALRAFFADGEYVTHVVPNKQRFDFEGLKGRLLSSSYAPAEGQSGHEAMIADLRRLFEAHQVDGQVCFTYDTRFHIGC
jgi:SAM-dependent methyltransferase